jgi:hypothetical protein
MDTNKTHSSNIPLFSPCEHGDEGPARNALALAASLCLAGGLACEAGGSKLSSKIDVRISTCKQL